LKGPEIQQASGLINLARQLGGSFGIAYLNTYVSNMTAYHRANIVSHMDAGNAAFLTRQASAVAHFAANGFGPEAARQAALHSIDRTVQVNASTMAYNDAFLLLGITFVIASPAIFLLGRVKKPATAGAGGGH
jgi:DHA2 family multidrug resistance protein